MKKPVAPPDAGAAAVRRRYITACGDEYQLTVIAGSGAEQLAYGTGPDGQYGLWRLAKLYSEPRLGTLCALTRFGLGLDPLGPRASLCYDATIESVFY